MAQSETVLNKKRAKIEKSFNRLFVNWIGWKVLLPLLLISFLWPLIHYILEIPHSFGRAFAHGDLLIFSALVLMEAATEGEQNQEQTMTMEAIRIIAKIFAIIFIIGFVATKADILRKENELVMAVVPGGHDMLSKKMLAYSCLNCTVALVSVVSSVLLFWFNVDKEKKQEFDGLAAQ
jgi:hypothetical protein